jgi:NitT/TauT family transport system substrate-binding protein
MKRLWPAVSGARDKTVVQGGIALMLPLFRFGFVVVIAWALMAVPVRSAEATEITVGYTALADYVPLFVANDEGIFKKNGLDVRLQLVSNSAMIPPALLANSLQIAGLALPVFLQAVAGGLDLRLIAGNAVTPKEMPNGSVMARSGSGIRVAADLPGKKVGISGRGSFYQILLVKWLEDRGVDSRKVEFVEIPFLKMGDLLKTGQVDAVAVGEPFVSRIRSSGAGFEMAPFLAEFGVDIPRGGFAVEEKWGRENAATIAAMRASLHEAIAVLDRNPALIEIYVAKYLKVAPDVLKSAPLNRLDDSITPEMLDFWQVLMLHQGMMTTQLDAALYIIP